MTNRTPKRGASAKLLALLASTTMILAALVGVGFAASASAVTSYSIPSSDFVLQAGWNTCFKDQNDDAVTWDASDGSYGGPVPAVVTAPADKVIVEVCVKAGADNDSSDGGAYIAEVNPGQKSVTFSHPTKNSISHWAVRYGDAPPATVGVEVTGDFECVPANREGPAQWKLIWTVKNTSTNSANLWLADGWLEEEDEDGFANVPSGDSVDYWQYVKTTGTYTLAWIAVNDDGESDPVTGTITVTGQCGNTAEITCSAWSASVTIPPVVLDDYSLQDLAYPQPRSVEVKTGVVQVFIDGTLVKEGQLDDDGKWSDSGSIAPPFEDGAAHTLTVEVDGEVVVSDTSGTCAVPTCQELNNCPTTTTQDSPPPPAQVTPVVEAATVAAPAEAPAAAAPAPATVAIPAKATLPAAVPAGDGSQTPGLPLWAVALMVVGLLGAAGSIMGVRRSRS